MYFTTSGDSLGLVNSDPSFTDQPKVVNGLADLDLLTGPSGPPNIRLSQIYVAFLLIFLELPC